MEKEKVKNYLCFIVLLVGGIIFIGASVFLGLNTGEWFGKWTMEPMIAFLFIGVTFIVLSFTYFFDIKGDCRLAKIIRNVVFVIYLIIVIGFILSSFLITW